MGLRAALAVTATFLLGLAAGLVMPEGWARLVMGLARELVQRVYVPDPLQLALRIFLNNARAVLLMVALSPIVPVPALITMANGVFLGVAFRYAASATSLEAAVLAVAPHGVIEIPAFLYAAASATSFGVPLWRKAFGGRGSWPKILGGLARAVALALLLLALAALVEALVTPALLRLAGLEPGAWPPP